MSNYYYWLDFEPEPDTTGDGEGDPDKHILTIKDPQDEEFAVIVHRICGGRYPLDGRVAGAKRDNARLIVYALNRIRDEQRYPNHDDQGNRITPADEGVAL